MRSLLRAVVVATALWLAAAAAAGAAPPPMLDGVGFTAREGVYYGVNGYHSAEQQTPDGGFLCEFGGYDTLGGSYAGHIEMAGTIELGPRGEFGYAVRDGFSDFAIDSETGYVTGVQWPSRTGEEQFCGANTFPMGYRAFITTPDGGVFTDSGTSEVSIFPQRISPPWHDIIQTFDSSQTATERVLFGNHATPRSFDALAPDTKLASAFTLFMPATVRKVVAYVDGKGAASGSQTLRAVLYRRGTNGGPGAYVTRSFEFTVPAGMPGRWVPLWLAPIPKLAPGVYWIGIQSAGDGAAARFGWRLRAGGRRFNADAFADGASDPFGAATMDDRQLAAFAAGSYP
jgi:hypothetical protein